MWVAEAWRKRHREETYGGRKHGKERYGRKAWRKETWRVEKHGGDSHGERGVTWRGGGGTE